MVQAGDADLGLALRRLRLARKLSLQEMSQRANVSKAALSAWENGTRHPRGPALARLLDALGADPRTKARLLHLADPQQAQLVLADSPYGATVDVGMVLRVMRARRGISQADLARQIGVSQAALSKWEVGDAAPSAETLHAIGFALGATAEETLALTSVVGSGDGGLPNDLDTAIARIWEGRTYHPLRGLLLLGWEAELGRRVVRDVRWEPGLAAVLSARACLLFVENRDAEVAPIAQRAIRLSTTTETRLQAVPALGSLDHALRRMGRDDAATAEMAEKWAGCLPDSPSRAWMLRQCGLTFVRHGRVREGLKWIEQSSDVELQARPEHPEPWSHRAEMLADAYLAAGDPRGAAAVVGGRRARRFPSNLFVKIEHANGRAVTESEMAWLRHSTAREGWPQGLRGIAELERRQAYLTGSRNGAPPIPSGPGAEEKLWAAVLRDHPG